MQNVHVSQGEKLLGSASKEIRLGLAVLVLTTLLSFLMAAVHPSLAAFGLASLSLLLLFALFAVGVLRLKVTTPTLKLEEQVGYLETETKELKRVSEALLQSLYVGLSIPHRPFMGGPSIDQYALIHKYVEPIKNYIGDDVLLRVAHDLESLPELSDEEANRVAWLPIPERMREAERKKPAAG